MKKIILTIFISFSLFGFSQSPIVEICGDIQYDETQANTYFKDVNNTFDKFIGTWKYENGNDIVIFEITKVTQKYDEEYQIYEDYLVGNYSYSNDGGTTYVINTISSLVNQDAESNAMYSPCQRNANLIIFSFKELILNKSNYHCTASFEFLPNSLTQMTVLINNPDGVVGHFVGEEPFNFNFSIPIEMTVVKQ